MTSIGGFRVASMPASNATASAQQYVSGPYVSGLGDLYTYGSWLPVSGYGYGWRPLRNGLWVVAVQQWRLVQRSFLWSLIYRHSMWESLPITMAVGYLIRASVGRGHPALLGRTGFSY